MRTSLRPAVVLSRVTRQALASLTALLLVAPTYADSLPAGNVPLQPARWRPVRQVVQKCADQSHFRWAMPDTISRRAWTGSLDKKELPIAAVLTDICKQTGLPGDTRKGR